MATNDFCTREGALRLKERIEAYWKERGYDVNIAWRNGELKRAEITARDDRQCVLKISGKELAVADADGTTVAVQHEDDRTVFAARAGRTYIVTLSETPAITGSPIM